MHTLKIVIVLTAFLSPMSAWAADEFWRILEARDDTAILMRHAIAPGTGDPNNFELGDCSTQRNLSPRGRQQARAIGNVLKQRGWDKLTVFTSQWCRCRETAKLLSITEPQDLSSLNSFFQRSERREEQTQATRDWLAKHLNGAKRPVLVTHQVNITALTDYFPASGEMLLIHLDDEQKVKILATYQVSDY